MRDSAIGKCIGNDEEGIGSSRKKYVLRVTSTLNQYSDIVSDIPSGSIHGIFILTFCLTISDILSGKYSDIVSGISSGILAFFLELSGICSDILSRILSGISSEILCS